MSTFSNFMLLLTIQSCIVSDSPGKKRQVHNEPSSEKTSFPDSEDVQDGHSIEVHGNTSIGPPNHLEKWQFPLMPVVIASFPRAVQAFVDAIQKNMTY